MTRLVLTAIRTKDPKLLLPFYTAIGIDFVEERHGQGPLHFAGSLALRGVFEIYPGEPDGATVGFGVPTLDFALKDLEKIGITPLRRGRAENEREYAVLRDPDGRRVELYEL